MFFFLKLPFELNVQGGSFAHTDFMCLFQIVIFLEVFCLYLSLNSLSRMD